MHWRTYDRLLEQAEEAEAIYDRAMIDWLDKSAARLEAVKAKR